MRKAFYLVWFLCLMTNIASGADAVLMPDGTRIGEIRETYVAPDLGVNIGKADMVQGNAVVIHSGSPAAFRIRQDIPLFKDDAVITLKGGRTRLRLNDGSVLTLASETKLVLNQSVYDPEAQTRSSFMNMTFGKARFLVKKLKDVTDSNFKIKTNTAVVGVRGSDFIITADISSTEVVTLDHTRLEVVSLTDPNMTKTILNDYERIILEQNALPSAIEAISTEEAKQIMKGLEIGSEKVQAGMDKNLKGIEGKDALAPEKAKDEIRLGFREKSDVKQGVVAAQAIISAEKTGDVKVGPAVILPEKVKTEQSDVKTETQDKIKVSVAPAVEAPKPEVISSDKAEVKSEIKADIQSVAKEPVSIAAPTIESPQMTVRTDIRTDIQNAIKESASTAVPVVEVLKPEIVEKPVIQEVLRSAVVGIVVESKDSIQKVAEIKVQSANDATIKDKAVPINLSSASSTVQIPVSTDTKLPTSTDVVSTDTKLSTSTDTTQPVSSTGTKLPTSTDVVSTDTKLSTSTDTTQPVSSTGTKLPTSTDVVSTDTKLSTSTDTTQPVSSTDTKLSVSTPVSTDTKLHVSTIPVSTDVSADIKLPVSADTKTSVSTPVPTDTKLHVSAIPLSTDTKLPVSTDVSADTKLPVSADTKPSVSTTPVSTDTKLPVSTDTTLTTVPQVADVVKVADILPVVTDTKLTLPRSKTHVIK